MEQADNADSRIAPDTDVIDGQESGMTMDDPFARLGLPRRFALEARAVQSAYLRRLGGLHPDREPNPLKREEAAREAALVNEARRVLLDDEARANALLTLLGGVPEDAVKALPEGFLMEMMEVREDMEQALTSHDPEEAARVEAWAREQRSAYFTRLEPLWDAAAGSDASALHARCTIRRELNALRYIERMIEQIDPA